MFQLSAFYWSHLNQAEPLKKIVLLLGVMVCFGFTIEAFAEGGVRVVKIQNRVASELVSIVDVAMTDQGSAVVDERTNSLVLVGPKEAIEAGLELIQILDQLPRMLVLSYESKRASDLSNAGINVDWSAESDGIQIGNVDSPSNGSRVVITPMKRRDETNTQLTGSVRVMEGEETRIMTGQSIPIRHAVHELDREYESTTWVTAGSGFWARPRILGDGRIEISLRPIESSVDEEGSVSFSSAITTVIVRPGEVVTVGTLSSATVDVSKDAWGGVEHGQGQQEWVVLLTAEIEGNL